MSESLDQKVIRIIADAKNRDPAGITTETPMEELGLDSLDGMSIIFDLENAFDIEIPEDAPEKAHTVGELVEGLRLLIDARGPA
jgi:acyl carrier protein